MKEKGSESTQEMSVRTFSKKGNKILNVTQKMRLDKEGMREVVGYNRLCHTLSKN